MKVVKKYTIPMQTNAYSKTARCVLNKAKQSEHIIVIRAFTIIANTPSLASQGHTHTVYNHVTYHEKMSLSIQYIAKQFVHVIFSTVSIVLLLT